MSNQRPPEKQLPTSAGFSLRASRCQKLNFEGSFLPNAIRRRTPMASVGFSPRDFGFTFRISSAMLSPFKAL